MLLRQKGETQISLSHLSLSRIHILHLYLQIELLWWFEALDFESLFVYPFAAFLESDGGDRGIIMQADQTVLSLRPGGGGNRGGSRGVLGPRFDSSSSDLPLLRPHGGAGAPLSLKVHSFLSLLTRSRVYVFC